MIISLMLALVPLPSAAGQQAAAGSNAADLASVVRIPLLDRELAAEKTVKSIKAARIDFRPGQKTGRHVHPVPTMGIVLGGEIRLQIEGEPVRVLKAGEAFFEPADTVVLHFENASNTHPASFAGFYLLGPDDKEIIREAR
ncbi:cupin domain-containing protein [Sphingomonas psychrotolerans]|uniref:Cupin domain-containing protein n=1 Tax=Sphingomonas psychrotolerans TaxID=1327635 RepID=A0ABU3N2I3_9SPHN|nr:cupin domain-containing protein [Sphingomonas psychrotolerans]MDT8758764.1 cupin domain-containing protein [Sphingomonas psychrotolerans]